MFNNIILKKKEDNNSPISIATERNIHQRLDVRALRQFQQAASGYIHREYIARFQRNGNRT